MSYVTIILLSLLNIALIWYIKSILSKFVFLSENIDDMFHSLDEYSQHLESLYQLETYYGDATLEALIKHSRVVTENVKKFKDVYSLEELEEPEEDGDEEE
jgi:hypothetical protein|tara:strand:+ start:1562 stop:1864 length:303 start_codon:yes stop_codon:yes gene_type:complete